MGIAVLLKIWRAMLFISVISLLPLCVLGQTGKIATQKINGKYADVGIGYMEVVVQKHDTISLFLHPEDTLAVERMWTSVVQDTMPEYVFARVPDTIKVKMKRNRSGEIQEIPADTVWREVKVYKTTSFENFMPMGISTKVVVKKSGEIDTNYIPVVSLAAYPLFFLGIPEAGSFKLHHSSTIYTITPLRWFEGDSDNKAFEKGSMGLTRLNPVLRFRVLEESEHWVKIVVDETIGRSLYVKQNAAERKLPPDTDVFDGLIGPVRNRTKQPGLFVVSWIEYLNAINQARTVWEDNNIYKRPKEGSAVVTIKSNASVIFTKMKGDWVQIADYPTRKVIGWMRWKDENRVLLTNIWEWNFMYI